MIKFNEHVLNEDKAAIKARLKKKNLSPLEKEEQKAFVRGLRQKNIFVASIPNGGKDQSAQYVQKLIEEGMMVGITDLIIALDRGRTIWLELKRRENGVLSKDQIKVHARLRALGHTVVVGYGAKDAWEKIKEHL
jgi:hypothetical protein